MADRTQGKENSYRLAYNTYATKEHNEQPRVERKNIGKVVKYKMPNKEVVLVKITPNMVGKTAEEAFAQVLANKRHRSSFYDKQTAPRFRFRVQRPSLSSVLEFISDSSQDELQAVVSKVISSSAGYTVVEKAIAATNREANILEDDGDVDQTVISAAGKMLTSQQVAVRMGKTRQGVNEMLKRGAILGIRYGTHWKFPSAQFDKTAPVAGLMPLLKTVSHLDPWDALSIILSPEADREQRPLELLKGGKRIKAIAIASRKAADLRPLSEVDRVIAALSADMAAEERADFAADTLAKRRSS